MSSRTFIIIIFSIDVLSKLVYLLRNYLLFSSWGVEWVVTHFNQFRFFMESFFKTTFNICSNISYIYRSIVILKELLSVRVIRILLPSSDELLPLDLVNSENILGYLVIQHDNLAQLGVRKRKEHDNNVERYPVSQEWLLVELVNTQLGSVEDHCSEDNEINKNLEVSHV